MEVFPGGFHVELTPSHVYIALVVENQNLTLKYLLRASEACVQSWEIVSIKCFRDQKPWPNWAICESNNWKPTNESSKIYCYECCYERHIHSFLLFIKHCKEKTKSKSWYVHNRNGNSTNEQLKVPCYWSHENENNCCLQNLWKK